MHPQLKDSARLGEEEHRRVRVCDQQVLGVVGLTGARGRVAGCLWLGPAEPDATALLGTEGA